MRTVAAGAAPVSRPGRRRAANRPRRLHVRQTGALEAENLWAANGSNEILQQLLRAFGPGRAVALGFVPSYSMHRSSPTATQTRWLQAARADDFGLTPDVAVTTINEHRPDVVFVTSPNNPTGQAFPLDDLRRLLDAMTGASLIVDGPTAGVLLAAERVALIDEYPPG